LFLLVSNVAVFFMVKSGHKPDPEESSMRWATLVRVVDLAMWMVCVCALYLFFFLRYDQILRIVD
jgi:hypothetical protein